MGYLLTFLEGIITFISPCMLPMLPIYVTYFIGGEIGNTRKKTFLNASGFVLGFTVIFVMMGAFAGAIGYILINFKTLINIITGTSVAFFGLCFMGVFKLKIFKGFTKPFEGKKMGFCMAFLFGTVFAVGWTPCVGAFLGAALMSAAQSANNVDGILLLLAYSMGLGIPFIISAILLDKLKNTFTAIKLHYSVINFCSGVLLFIVGVLMTIGIIG